MWSLEVIVSDRKDTREYIELFTDFKIKKFADKLKDFVCILIGCTREQLEDQDFKNKELGEEWNCYIFNNGKKEELTLNYNIAKTLSADNRVISRTMTPRLLLQLIGTECIRDKVHPNAWVNALFSSYLETIDITNKSNNKVDINNIKEGDLVWHFPYNWELKRLTKEDIETGQWGTGNGNERFRLENCYLPNIITPNWIITDMRFPNELKAVKDRGGITIRVNRPVLNETSYEKAYRETHEHESENSLDSATFDFVINNDKDLNILIEKVKEILIKEKII